MSPSQSPIFTKTYDFLLWLLNHTERFPKNERFRMAKRLENTAFMFYDLLVQAARDQHKQTIVSRADLELDKLRLYMRLSRDRGMTKPRQYEHAARLLTEIGKLLGGWLKSVSHANMQTCIKQACPGFSRYAGTPVGICAAAPGTKLGTTSAPLIGSGMIHPIPGATSVFAVPARPDSEIMVTVFLVF